jgi:hypothetical protein
MVDLEGETQELEHRVHDAYADPVVELRQGANQRREVLERVEANGRRVLKTLQCEG